LCCTVIMRELESNEHPVSVALTNPCRVAGPHRQKAFPSFSFPARFLRTWRNSASGWKRSRHQI
jgi:hypothetical protein